MHNIPKSLRPHIVFLGRCNAGKSSIFNAFAGKRAAIVSSQPGTTTDPVELPMEYAPLGPIVLVDTPGIDDESFLGSQRTMRTQDKIALADLAIIVTEGNQWGQVERFLASKLSDLNIPFIIACNKMDLFTESSQARQSLPHDGFNLPTVPVSAKTGSGIPKLVELMGKILQDASPAPNSLIANLVPESGLVVMVAPQDASAPKGRLIMPQAQLIRDCLDHEITCMVLTPAQYHTFWHNYSLKPDLAVCDSRIVRQTVNDTPPHIKLTTFSILMANVKGDINLLAQGAKALENLQPGDSVLVQEACSHHPLADDIARTKIPIILQKFAGGRLDIHFTSGKDHCLSDNKWKLVVHCGGCMLTSRQMRTRQMLAEKYAYPMTNFGMVISLESGVLERCLEIFPDALSGFHADAHTENT